LLQLPHEVRVIRDPATEAGRLLARRLEVSPDKRGEIIGRFHCVKMRD
jgi:hypothetical protein